ncbi:glycosyltransferase family 4 protein [Lysinimonas soli]|uniref:Glycosyltransferase family 4 protein n=1 Tax=Lysinimonas soli TaxID=1074233 RepID=A0ABW0NM31_9MICO
MDEFVAFLARGLRERGAEVAILLVPVGVARGVGPIGQDLLAEGIEVVDGDAVKVDDWIEGWAPAVISVHGNARSPIDAGHRLGVPVVLVLHGMHDLFGLSDSEVLDRYARLTGVISVSELVRRQYLSRSPLIDPARVLTIPNGIDPHRTVGVDRAAARAALGLDDEFLFLSLARHSMQKNTYGLVSAFDELARSHSSAQLLICGRVDDPAYARQVIALRDRSSFANRIHLRSGSRRPDALLASADAFVLDSFFEGWPLAPMEALLAGVPVITSDVGGAREQLAGGPSRGVVIANPLGDPLAVGWESMARARFAPQVNRAELIAAMNAFAGHEIELASAEEIATDARARFSADRCLDLHANAIRVVAAGMPLSELSDSK